MSSDKARREEPTPFDGNGSETDDGEVTVLAVDDDRDLADTYSIWLSEKFDVRTAYNGEEALEKIDDDVDVVLLDRRMPDRSGGEVLAEIRDRDLSCRVSMLTAVEPDEDIVEMRFDEYLVKPVEREEVVSVVENLYARREYADELQEYYAVTSKIGALEAQLPPEQQSDSEALAQLRDRAAELEDEATTQFEEVGDAAEAFREV